MRLVELGLLAFGPFTDVRLDFSRPGVLHVIYGPNEAGKSTALRAITNVLYGIPIQTTDAHRHAMPDLRIAARLTGTNGTTLEVVRRKGAKNTLLDANGNPLGSDALAPLLSGINEAVFSAMFGLDHSTLRKGAEDLLHGKGAVGESLFAAAIGGPGLHALLRELERDTDALYRPRAQNPPLNEAIEAYKAAERRTRESARSADAYRTQQQALDEVRAENAGLAERRRALGTELSRLRRALHVLPLLMRRRQLETQRAALGDVPRLPEDAGLRRARAQAERDEALREQGRLAAEIADLTARRAALRAPESVLAIDAAIIDTLQNRVGSVRAAAGDLPRRRGELGGLEEQAATILRELERAEALDRVDDLRISAAAQARIRALAEERSGVFANREHAAQALAAGQAKLGLLRMQRATLPPVPDLRGLQQALQRAQRLGEIDEAITAGARLVHDLEIDIRARLDALPLWGGNERDLRLAALPAMETIAEFRQRFEHASAAREEVAQRLRALDRRATELSRDVDAVQLAGAVPSEADLDQSRRQRDTVWARLREQWRAGAAHPEALAIEFEAAVRAVDHLADRLRREASRVATLARLTADRTACASEREIVQREEAAAAQAETRLREEWVALWSASGVQPLDPSVMSGWMLRVGELLELTARCEQERKNLTSLRERRDRQREQLGATVTALSGETMPAGEDLGSVLEWAENLRIRLGEAQTRQQVLADGIATLEADQPALEQQAQLNQERWEVWQRAWAACLAPLRLPPSASPQEALAVLDQLARLFAKLEEIARLRQRIHAMEDDAQRLADDVAALARQHANELTRMPAVEGAEQLIRAYRTALDEQRERARIDAELRGKSGRAHDCAELVRHADAELQVLMQQAAVTQLDDLEPMEQVAAEAVRLEHALRELDDELIGAGEGASVSDLAEQTRALDVDVVRARIAEVEAEMEELADIQRGVHQRIGSLEAGIQHQESAEGAADAATEAQEHLAAIRSGVRKYLRLRLASLVIRREIERYREQNQGPLIARASELFPRLTLGNYSGVRVGFDENDEPVLRCVNRAGADVGVQELSDGTRDQLYLALRVATLERHAETNPSMPVVLDDVLVHFDDARTSAALTVLGELAAHTQVLLFTHHARVVELARAALPAEGWVEHRL